MRFSMKLFFFTSMLLLGVASAALGGMAEELFPMPPELQGYPVFLLVGAAFGVLAYLLVVAFYPREAGSVKPQRQKAQDPAASRKDQDRGLLTKKAFDRDLASLKSSSLYSLIVMDVDNFKAYKGEHGGQVADTILQKIGRIARANIRSNDRVYKYEGDLFAVILLNCDKDQAIRIAEKIRVQVNRLDNSPFPGVTLSAAVVSFPQDGDLTADLLQASEELLQSAKKSGKNATFALARGKIS